MFYKIINDTAVLRLEIGEEIISSVLRLADELKIRSGIVQGIGAVKKATVGMFDFSTGEYTDTEFCEFMELISLDGNITEKASKPYLHLHACFGRDDGCAVGGHLREAVIGATAEIFIRILPEAIERIHNDSTGLNVLGI